MEEVYNYQPDDYYDDDAEHPDPSYPNEESSSATSFDPNKITSEYHIQQAEMALHNLKIVVRESGWKKVLQHKSGISVYSKPRITVNDNIPVFMGEHIIEGFTSQAIFAVIGIRKLWDDWYEEGKLVENLNETTSLTYMIMQAIAGSKTRDLSLVEKIECEQNGLIHFVTSSVETPKVPRVANKIRAHINLNGWILEPLTYNPPRTKVTYVLQTQVKGWVPSILSKTYLARRPLVLNTIDQYLQRNGPPPMVISSDSIRDSSAPSDVSSIYQANTIQSDNNSVEIKYLRRKISFTDIDETNLSPEKQDIASASPIPTTEEIQNDSLIHQDDSCSPKIPSSSAPSSPTRSMSPVQPPPPPSPSIVSQTKSISKPIQHRHTAPVQKALETFKSHIPLDGWSFYSENKDVKIYMKECVGKSTPIMRGDSVISGFTSYDILSVIKNLDTRKFWDERYDEGAAFEMFSLHEHLVRTAMKGTFPISGRDFSVCGTLDHDKDNGSLHFVTTSVVDPLIPESKKHVRGDLEFAGWLLKPHFDTEGNTTSVDITYIVDIDIKLDTVPSSIRKALSTQIPMIVAKMNESMQKIGFSPYVLDSTTKIIKEEFSIKNYQYDLSLIAEGDSVIEFKISKLMYPKGVDVSTIPENCKVELLENGAEVIRVTFPPRVDLDTLIITVSKNSKDFQMTHNRGQKIPIASNSSSNCIPITKNPKPKTENEKPAEGTQKSIPIQQKQSKHPNHTTNVTTSTNATLVVTGTVETKTENHKMIVPASRSIITPETFFKPPEVLLKSEPYQRMLEKQTLLENKIAAVTKDLTPPPKTEEPIEPIVKNEVIENNISTLKNNIHNTGDVAENNISTLKNNIHNTGNVEIITDSIRFNPHQIGLMFASMLLAYYAGKLST